MYIQFDKQRMHLQVICGSLEEYSPSEEIKEAQARTEALKKRLAKFQEDIVFPEIKAIEDIINKLNPTPTSED